MTDEKIAGLLGLAYRAGAIAAGAMQVEKALLSGRCQLLLIGTFQLYLLIVHKMVIRTAKPRHKQMY